MSTFEIPTGPSARTFQIDLNGTIYRLRLGFMDAPEAGWFLDIFDTFDTPLVCGIPLVTGCDLLSAYRYLGIGGYLFVATDGDPSAVPTFDSLGITSRLLFEPYS